MVSTLVLLLVGTIYHETRKHYSVVNVLLRVYHIIEQIFKRGDESARGNASKYKQRIGRPGKMEGNSADEVTYGPFPSAGVASAF